MIKIKYGDSELDSDTIDIDLYQKFSMDEADISVLTIYNPYNGLTEALERDKKDVVIELDKTIISIGDIIKNIPDSTEDTVYLMIILTESLDKIHEIVLTQSFSNTNYSKILEKACNLSGVSSGKIEIINDIKFENYTLYGTLNELLKEIKANTGVNTYIRNGMVYATDNYIDSFELESSLVSTNKKLYLDQNKIVLKKVIPQLNQGVKIIIDKKKYLIVKGEHKYSTVGKENLTSLEVVEIE